MPDPVELVPRPVAHPRAADVAAVDRVLALVDELERHPRAGETFGTLLIVRRVLGRIRDALVG